MHTLSEDHPTLAQGHFFRHQDGGIYRLVDVATHTDNLEQVVVYRHIWPFEKKLWVRPLSEWESRFTRIDAYEAMLALKKDQKAFEAEIQAAKTARRAAQQAPAA